jgi:hypothetical protein
MIRAGAFVARMWLSKKQPSASELAPVSFFDHQSRQAEIRLPRGRDCKVGWLKTCPIPAHLKTYTIGTLKLDFAAQKKGAWPSRPCGDWPTLLAPYPS